jgi:plasmid stabilization system protein ParE
MTYLVEFTDRAVHELEILFVEKNAAESHAAARWYNGLEQAVDALASYPIRCPVIPEAPKAKRKLRHLLYGKKPHVYRVVYEVDERRQTVWVLTIRHGARRKINPPISCRRTRPRRNRNFFLCYNSYSCIQAIIRHEVGVPSLKKVPILLLFLLPASLMWLSCGTSSPNKSIESSATYRAFVTNNVSAGTLSAGIYIVDAETNVRVSASISAGNNPGMMVLTPNRAQTLVFSGDGTATSDNLFSIIDNAKQTNASHLTLPGMTESFVVSPDSSTAYVAVPTAPVTGQSPGVVEVVNLSTGAITTSISCPPVNTATVVCDWSQVSQGFNPPYSNLAIGNTGTRLIALSAPSSSVADTLAVITPSSIGTPNPVVTFVPGFDHPVAAFFSSDDSIAYVLNCGAECGGTQASIQQLNLTTNTLGAYLPVCTPLPDQQCAGSVALVNGSTMYVAGTPYSTGGVPSQPCTGETTAAQSCGLLSVVDLSTMSVINSGVVITDGYHSRISLASNGQLFIGASTCTEISTATETRGCLSIYNTLSTAVGTNPSGGVLIPPQNGDVTGIQPIAGVQSSSGRTVAYVIQGASLYIYDTTTDALLYNSSNPNDSGRIINLVGDFVDVITPDF